MDKLVVLQCHLCAGRIDKDSLVCANCGYAYKLVDEAIIENLMKQISKSQSKEYMDF